MDCITTNCDRRHYAQKLYRVARSAVQRGPGKLPAGVMDYITQSRRSKAIIAPYLPKGARCHPLPPLIEVPHAPPVDVASNNALVAVGRLDPGKGVEVLLQAARRSKMSLTLIGDGDQQLRAEAEAVEGCRVTGWLTPQQVVEELSHARCLVFPSLWYETYGLVVDEAAARGIPSVVSDISAASERVEDGKTGWVARAGDVDDLMRCLHLTNHDDSLRAVGIAAYDHFWARHPTRGNHAVALMKTYDAILTNRLASGSSSMADQRPKERNIKIAINAGILDDRLSGLGVYTTNVTSRLARLKDVDISIYTAKPEALSAINDANVHLIPSIVQPKYGKVGGLARFIWNQFVFPFLVAKRDLIYCTTHHGILWGYARQVITVHDLLPVKFPDQYRLQTAYYRHLLPILIKKAKAVITISENTKRDLYEQYQLPSEKVHVVYNGIDHDRFFVPAADLVARFKRKYSLGNYLLIVGASFPHKNVGAALRAFHK
ncbi:MAG: glycosyltransferase, partial [Candidatus Acidiferrum sp.]